MVSEKKMIKEGKRLFWVNMKAKTFEKLLILKARTGLCFEVLLGEIIEKNLNEKNLKLKW